MTATPRQHRPTVHLSVGAEKRQTPGKRVALDFLSAMAEGDAERIAALTHADAEWHGPRSARDRIAWPVRGRDGVAALASGRTLASFTPGTTVWNVHHILAEDDLVAIHVNRRAAAASGRPYDSEYHWLFRLADGQIVEIREILDTAHAMRQLGPAEEEA